MYLALRNISKRWTMPIKNWSGAMNQYAILFEGRVANGRAHLKRTYTESLEPPHDPQPSKHSTSWQCMARRYAIFTPSLR